MPTTLTNGIQLPDKGSVDWYNSMQSNYNLIDTHLGDTDTHVTAEDKANWNSKQGSLSQAQLDAIAQVATNTSDIATLQSGKANASHTHSSSDITDIGDYATKQYVDSSISGLVDNAPDALNTLNELSAALNDDSNFASTVTTALNAKANSADLATVATSGSYNDLSNKPTINDSTITIQKNGSTVDTFTTNGSAKTIDIPVPTKTSDLTNDSNFVDTSNPAVASGITSAKVTDYDTHIADTDIHVTTADKNKWNNNTYVFRYSSTALVASSTNSNTLLDNTDNLKVGDKVIDSDGVLFSITAIDTANSTFTVGSALVDLALDANVVHKSGNETIDGTKTFSKYITSDGSSTGDEYSNNAKTNLWLMSNRDTEEVSGVLFDTYRQNIAQGTGIHIIGLSIKENSVRYEGCRWGWYWDNNLNGYTFDFKPTTQGTNQALKHNLGTSTDKWSEVHGVTYYYGSSDVEFSNKFVTTDTAQTITGNKTFSSNTLIYNSDNTATTPSLYLKSSKIEISSQGNTSGDQNLTYLDKNSTAYAYIKGAIQSNGSAVKIRAVAKDSSNNLVINELQMLAYTNGNKAIFPSYSNEIDLGVSNYKWKSFNGVEPSSLSLPSGNANDVIDISSYLVNLDGAVNTYTAPANGYISITMNNCSGIQAYITGLWGHQIVRPSTGGVRFLMPILKDKTANILIFGGTIDNARFIPCQGNV